MHKEIRVVDEQRGIVQITTADERWYTEEGKDPLTGLPAILWYPSITFITGSYPKGIGYMQWLAKHGWDEAEAIKVDAGDRGTIVHHAIERLLKDGELAMDAKIKDRDGVERDMTPDEYYCALTFKQWYESAGCPLAIAIEHTVISKEHKYAGTLDYIFQLADGTRLLLDIKTSRYVWPSHELQVSALKKACLESNIHVDAIAILQVGYTANKTQHYKLTLIDDCFPLFLATRQIWEKDHGTEKPLQREYPLKLQVNKIDVVMAPVPAKDVRIKAKK